jgi:hypothetical protein
LPKKDQIDFDLLVAKINELNIVSGEGVFKVEHTADGARLKVKFLAHCCIFIHEEKLELFFAAVLELRNCCIWR